MEFFMQQNRSTGLLRQILGGFAIAAAVSFTVQADTHTVDTAYGPVAIEGSPERVVTLYEGALDAALASGVTPVGAIITRGGDSVADYIQAKAGDVKIVGTPGETNLEAVIALNPDVILASSRLSEEQYKLLSQIAPTVVPDFKAYQPDTWIKETRLFAEALNQSENAEKVLMRVQERTAEVEKLVAAKIAGDDRKTALIRWMPQGALVMAEGLFSSSLLQATGFDVDDAGIVQEGRPHSRPLSQENLGLIDHQWVFLATLNADGREALETARKSPAFERMQANQNNRIVTVNGQLWTSASGPIAALALLDDIATAVNQLP
ncbi:iron-siderophore ABC transporter substrate-binding protein [Marinobacter salinexigens]|uniref:Iron-siderophore ABC transporter substrate-binding protein n=2 Tax=Marinobacter salinexigens TaxID=2919747 RepID=A0A5B0VIL5_9GAMM|nr:iron-siderophore ABC transporter substrate-binding protein [Marinobacter salinexigens]